MKKYCILLFVFLLASKPLIYSQSETFSIDKIKILLHKKINNYREIDDLSPYFKDEGLEKSAQNQCNYIFNIQKLTHKQPDSRFQTTVDRIRYFSKKEYMNYGENCLKTYVQLSAINSQQVEEITEHMFQM